MIRDKTNMINMIVSVIIALLHHHHFFTVFDVDQSHKPSPQVSASDRWTHSRDDGPLHYHMIKIFFHFHLINRVLHYHMIKTFFHFHMINYITIWSKLSTTDIWSTGSSNAQNILLYLLFASLYLCLYLYLYLSHTWSRRRHIIHVCLLSEKQLLPRGNICVPGNPVTSFYIFLLLSFFCFTPAKIKHW